MPEHGNGEEGRNELSNGRAKSSGTRSGLATSRRAFLLGSAAALGASTVPTAGATEQTGRANAQTTQDTGQVATATNTEGMVASVHPQATEIGVDVLRNGGNAVDAAVAVQFALNVVQPHSSGIGGGGFMVVYVAEEDELYAVDNRERAPLGAEPNMFLDEEGEPIPFEERHTNGEAVGIPGTLRAADVALKRFGTRSLPELIDPAIALARPGRPRVEVDAPLAEAIDENANKLNDAAREVFAPDGQPLTEGERLVQRDLAQTLRTIRNRGIESFYKGSIAEAIADVVQETGGSMRVDDLARYNVTIDHPEYAEYDDVVVRTMSLPSSGGLTIGQILGLLEPFALETYGTRSPQKYHLLLEAFNLAYADRGEYMGDKAFVDAPWQGLLDPAYLQRRRQEMNLERASPSAEPGDPWAFQPGEPYQVDAFSDGGGQQSARPVAARDGGQTTHFTTADSDGNLVSWTSTIEQFFGTGIMVPDHGFMLNNELTDFDATPGGPNEVQPYKRPLSSTSPTIVFRDGQPFMTVGSPGGKTIITTVAQVVLNVEEFGMSLPEAIAEPRLYRDTDPEVLWEEGIPEEVRRTLGARGHEFEPEPTTLGNVQAIGIDPETGEYLGAADSRRGGAVGGP